MATIDKKMQRLQAKLAKMQTELLALEKQKETINITSETPWVNELMHHIHQLLNKHQQKNSHALMRILIKEFGNGRQTQSSGKSQQTTRSVAPKYRDTAPGQENNTWSGRGLAPLWLQRYEAAGRHREEFLIR